MPVVGSPAAAVRADDVRRHNLARVLGQVHRDGELSRAELTHRLGLSRSTVGGLVNELSARGLVEELVPSGGSGVGRPSHLVGPRRGGPYVVGIDVEFDRVTVAAVGLGGSLLGREVREFQHREPEPAHVVTLVRQALVDLRARSGMSTRPAGIGVSVPATVDVRAGMVGVAPNLGWHDVPLAAQLSAVLDEEVVVTLGNDADLALLAEHRRGSAKNCDDVVFVMGRIGVGAGIILGGVPLHGHTGQAGEMGHIVIDSSGPQCHCGKRGCIETYVGDAALIRLAGRSGPPSEAAVAEVFDAARGGDQQAAEALRLVAASVGRAIAMLVNIIDPERVVLGGYLARLLEEERVGVEGAVSEYVHGGSRNLQLVRPGLGEDSALLGAAEVAFAGLLADPIGSYSS